MNGRSFSRRDFFKAAALAAAGSAVAACAPKEVIVTKEVVVTQQVEVTKEVEKTVKETVQVTVVAPAAKVPVHLNFFNRGGEYVFQTMDLQIA